MRLTCNTNSNANSNSNHDGSCHSGFNNTGFDPDANNFYYTGSNCNANANFNFNSNPDTCPDDTPRFTRVPAANGQQLLYARLLSARLRSTGPPGQRKVRAL